MTETMDLTTMELNYQHLSYFCACYPEPPVTINEVEGKSPRAWYEGGPTTKPCANLERFGDGLNRHRLIDLQADRETSTLELCIAILAWGGMHGANRDRLFNNRVEPWLGVAECVRNGHLTRRTSFDAFAALNHNGSLVGMGPAYFTKLIYFLMPREGDNPVGYIMDQWLGCSINLICAQEVVMMDHRVTWVRDGSGQALPAIRKADSTVSPLNTGEQYERFCQAVELIAERMDPRWTPDAAEIALLSKGGADPSLWRQYVKTQRLHALTRYS